jgi:Zn-dependent protease with chaperone function
VGQTAGKAQRVRGAERAARLARARQRRLELDKDREAREARIDAAVADVYQAQEDRQDAAQAIELADQRIGEALNRILGEGVALAQAAELTELSVTQVQRLRAAAAVDWYVHRSMTGVNACVTGGRSVAVSAGLVHALARGRLSEQQAVAILTHELAHHRHRATRYGLAIAWLTGPWRLAAAIFARLLRAIVGHVPTARDALVLVPVVGVIAAVQLAQHHAWLPLAALVGLALIVAVEPLAQAAISRASERAADDYTAQLGSGPDLAAALQGGHVTDRTKRRLATHPRLADRLDRLQGTAHH